jgi:hypothetical protein
MGYLDFVLNLIGLLLWINWRSLGFVAAPSALSIVAAVKPADKARGGRAVFLALVPVLLLLRALFYWQLGGPLDWTPKLPLGMLVISLKCETFGRYLLYSLLSFSLALAVFHIWMLVLSALQGRVAETDPLTKLIRRHLGPCGRWPAWAQFLLPFLAAIALWPLLRWLLAALGAMPAASGFGAVLRQALGMSLGVVVAWKYLLVGLLSLYLLNSYIYFGHNSFWNFITLSGRRLLWPISWLRLGKLDLGPIVGMLLTVGICEGLERWPEWPGWWDSVQTWLAQLRK